MLKHYVLALSITAITHFVLSVFVFLKGPRKLTNVTYGFYSLAIVWWSGLEALAITATDQASALTLWRLNHVGVIFIPIFFVHFVMSLLDAAERRLRRPVIAFGYLAGLGLLALDATPLLIQGAVPKFSFRYFIAPGPLYPFFFIGWVAWAVCGLLLLFTVYARSTGVRRNQLRYFCWSMLIAYVGGAPNFLPTFNIEIPWLMPFGTYAIPAYAVFTVYAIVRYRLMDVSVAFTRTAVFMVVYALALGVPLSIAASFQVHLERLLGSRWWAWLWIACAVLATGAHYANLYVQRFAERRLLAEQRRYQATLRRASQDMTRIRELPRLSKLTVGVLSKTMGITHVALYLQDDETKRYLVQAVRGGDRLGDTPAVEADDPLLRYLGLHKSAVVAEELRLQQAAEPGLRAVEETMRRLNAALVVPSFVHDALVGFVVMGAKRSGRIYTDDDLLVLMTLANQAALAIENARFYEQERVRQAEMFHTAQLASLGTLAGGMSHQINNRFYVLTILAGTMKAALQALMVENAAPDIREAITKSVTTFQKVEDNAIRGGDIVKTLLNFSKPGKRERVACSEILRLAMELADYRVKFEEVDLEQTVADPLPFVEGNKNQLTEAVYNLLTNAYDAIKAKEDAFRGGKLPPPGAPYRGAITLRANPVARSGAPWLQVVVHDSGIGMTPEHLSHLFVPFFTSKATAEKGTGLGLYVIKRIVESHGGTLEVSSIFGEGTTFNVWLPALAE